MRGRWIRAALVALAAAPSGIAGGPLLIEGGVPSRWSVAAPITLNLDQGTLGAFTNAEARDVVLASVGTWNSVATSALRLQLGAQLGRDVEDLGLAEFFALVTANDGVNPIVLDSSGAITEAVFGSSSGILGFAAPSLQVPSTRTIVKGYAVLNGAESQGTSTRRSLTAVLTHELGHLINLGHSQINGKYVLQRKPVPGFGVQPTAQQVETMFPILIDGTGTLHPMSTLERDDMAALSALYPAAGFAEGTGTIRGRVLDVDGATPILGLNVVARNVDDPLRDALSCVSGYLAGWDKDRRVPILPQIAGDYEIPGLEAGGRYRIYVEEIASEFRGGSSVGPRSPPLDLDPSADPAFFEYWNPPDETADDPPDDPLEATDLLAVEGAVAAGTDIIHNGLAPRLRSIDPDSGTYERDIAVTIRGSNLTGARDVRFDGATPDLNPFFLTDLRVVDSGTITGNVPAQQIPGSYTVVVTTARGTSDPPGLPYEVTEPPPLVDAVTPDVLPNHIAQEVGLEGRHLLGMVAARLVAAGLEDVDLRILRIYDAGLAVVEVPSGTRPGLYRVVATNSAGEGDPSAAVLDVTELVPALNGDISPSAAPRSVAVDVKIGGENLAGTSSAQLVRGSKRVAIVVRSATLDEVVAVVPAGLDEGDWVVSVTNTVSTVTGPTSFTVQPPPPSGGGGCSASPPGSSGGRGGLPGFLLALAALAALRAASGSGRLESSRERP